MYEALLKATPEYQKIAASFAKPGPAALFGLPPAGRALLYAALQKDLGRVLCIVTPGEAEATHFVDDLKALEAEGVEILTCGTCLNFYGLTEKLAVGGVTNMYVIAEKMLNAGNVVKP